MDNVASAAAGFQHRKDVLTNSAIFLAAFEGWSESTLTKASVKAGFPPLEARLLFPGGVMEVLTHYTGMIDRALEQKAEAAALSAMRVHERIYWLVKTRLELMAGAKDTLRQSVAWCIVNGYGIRNVKSVWNVSDKIWQLAGDISTDSNFYTKRGLLMKVYASTFFYWLNDESDNFQETWRFLQERIDGVLKLGRKMNSLNSKATQAVEQLVEQFVNRKNYRTKR